jgi:VanZ family protein
MTKHTARRETWLRLLGWAGALLVALWILSMTLVERGQSASVNLAPFSRKLPALGCLLGGCELPGERRAAGIFLFVDVLGNIAVFVPFGIAIAMATFPRPTRKKGAGGRRHFGTRGWLRVAGIGGLFSLGIEVAQLFMKTRATDIDDVILNTTGALIGAAIFSFLVSHFSSARST